MPAASGFDRRGKASWPMRLVIALLFLTIFASRCFAFGAYAVGYDAKRKQFESFLGHLEQFRFDALWQPRRIDSL
jgi:hypothetical protein